MSKRAVRGKILAVRNSNGVHLLGMSLVMRSILSCLKWQMSSDNGVSEVKVVVSACICVL